MDNNSLGRLKNFIKRKGTRKGDWTEVQFREYRDFITKNALDLHIQAGLKINTNCRLITGERNQKDKDRDEMLLDLLSNLNDNQIGELENLYNIVLQKEKKTKNYIPIPKTNYYMDAHNSYPLERFNYISYLFEMYPNVYSDCKEWKISFSNAYVEEAVTMNRPTDNMELIIGNSIEKNKQVIFTGAPGTGKTFGVLKSVEERCVGDKGRYEFVQFHPSYDYSDFIEGLRPVVIEKKDSMSFVRLDGIFKAFCRKIVESEDADKEYYFVVDEINRADLSKVFGELMFGLEEGYRGKDHRFHTQYDKLPTYMISPTSGKANLIEKDVFKDGFYIPENLTFIGTMNDIDRSVDSMDFALRRRFKWIEINANNIMVNSLKSILKHENNWDSIDPDLESLIEGVADRIIKMNENLTKESRFGLTEAYYVGPAYFKKLNLFDDSVDSSLTEIFDTNIVSIIKEYTRGRQKEEVKELITSCRDALDLPKKND